MKANDLTKAYNNVAKYTNSAFQAAVAAEKAKETFEVKSAEAIIGGQIAGKNETERKAAAMALFHEEYQAMKDTAENYEEQHNHLALSNIHLACLRDLLRLEELAKA